MILVEIIIQQKGSMKTHSSRTNPLVPLMLCLGVALVPIAFQNALAADQQVPLDIKLPNPAFTGTPAEIAPSPHLEKFSDIPRPPFLAPAGVTNVALNKKVSSSDPSPSSGTLDLVTDGDKEATDTTYVELHRRTQWVQIDLDAEFTSYAIVVWHAHNAAQVYRDVFVQVANDADFVKEVKTLYNNDYDNSSGFGIGTDKEYFETYEGRLIDGKGVKARYVRLYSRGSTSDSLNRYTEVEVHGLLAK